LKRARAWGATPNGAKGLVGVRRSGKSSTAVRAARHALVLALAAGISGCISAESWEAVRVLRDIDARGAPSELKATTPTPLRHEVAFRVEGRSRLADVYDPRQPIEARLVLVPGFTRYGKDDPLLVDLATTLARARFLVVVPELEGSRTMRVRLEDAEGIADSIRYLDGLPAHAPRGVGVMAISYAVGLALRASLHPDVDKRIRFVAGLGGYYDAINVVRFVTTGRYREGAGAPWQERAPRASARWIFMSGNIDVLDDPGDRAALAQIADRRMRDPEVPVDHLVHGLTAEGRALFDLLSNSDPNRVDGLVARLPGRMRSQLERLSPKNMDVSRLSGRLILIHGAEDTLSPYTESVALADAAGRAELFIVEGFSHIDPRGVGLAGRLTLIDAVQAVLARRHRSSVVGRGRQSPGMPITVRTQGRSGPLGLAIESRHWRVTLSSERGHGARCRRRHESSPILPLDGEERRGSDGLATSRTRAIRTGTLARPRRTP
jgi:hypothetical protein